MAATAQSPAAQYAELTAFQRDLLWAIRHAGASEYGLGIKAVLEESGYDDINNNRLYPNLNALVEKELIAKRTIDQRRKEYALTEATQELLADRQAWERGDA